MSAWPEAAYIIKEMPKAAKGTEVFMAKKDEESETLCPVGSPFVRKTGIWFILDDSEGETSIVPVRENLVIIP